MSLKNRGMFLLASRQRGFTLIEVMVTVIVLAIGLLGLAGLQATSLRFNSTAYQRSQATSLAYDIADRMRANIVQARAPNLAYNVTNFNISSAPPGIDLLADIDLGEWAIALNNALPNGVGNIANPAGNIIRIDIQWNDDRDATTTQLFRMETDL